MLLCGLIDIQVQDKGSKIAWSSCWVLCFCEECRPSLYLVNPVCKGQRIQKSPATHTEES